MAKMEQNKSCPDSEVLEEYRDGTASGEWASHIDNCENCQRRMASLDLLDLRMRKVCQPPNGMAARIKAAVHEGRAPSIRPVPFWRIPSYRIAASSAALVLLLSLSLYIIRDGGHQGIASGVPDNPPVVFERPKTKEAQDTEAESRQTAIVNNVSSMQKATAMPPAVQNITQNSNLRLAGTLSDGGTVKHKREVLRQPLGENVRHIWSVKDRRNARDLIIGIAKANDRIIEIDQREGGFHATIELKDTELQQLVDMLDDNGWRLLSPYIPQPREADAIEFRGNTVRYDVDAIEDGK